MELVVSAQSFQNLDRIDRVFSKFVGGSLRGAVLKIRVRVKDEPNTESGFNSDQFEHVKRIFDLRHELVREASRHSFFNRDTLDQILLTFAFVSISDIVLTAAIVANKDPSLAEKSEA